MSVISRKEVIEKDWEIIIIVIVHKYSNLFEKHQEYYIS